MPKRSDIRTAMVIGSGPIVLVQAAEFDYSGSQACRSLREEGVRTVLVNSNPATIQTDPDTADAVYVEPLTVEFLERILAKERPDRTEPVQRARRARASRGVRGRAPGDGPPRDRGGRRPREISYADARNQGADPEVALRHVCGRSEGGRRGARLSRDRPGGLHPWRRRERGGARRGRA